MSELETIAQSVETHRDIIGDQGRTAWSLVQGNIRSCETNIQKLSESEQALAIEYITKNTKIGEAVLENDTQLASSQKFGYFVIGAGVTALIGVIVFGAYKVYENTKASKQIVEHKEVEQTSENEEN